jgi:hypothetical protein
MAFTSIGDVGQERGGPLKPFLVLLDRGEPEHGQCRDGLRRRLPGPPHLIVIVADRNARQPQKIHHGRLSLARSSFSLLVGRTFARSSFNQKS